MNLKLLMIVAAFITSWCTFSQEHLLVYHGSGNTTQVFRASDKNSVLNPTIKLEQGEVLTVTVVNPNPLLYSYTLKTADIEIKTEEKEVTDLLATFSTILASRSTGFSATVQTNTNRYKNIIEQLTKDINQAKTYIINSDTPESIAQALAFDPTVGFRKALTDINGMPNTQYRFNNANLLSDLNALADSAGVDTFEKEAFKLLNSSLVEKINEIKKQTSFATTQTIWRQDFKISDKSTQISIEIEKIDKNNNTLRRDGNASAPFVINVAVVEPYFKRAILELVPVANITYAGDYNEFYLEDNIVKSRERSKTTINSGIILNVNIKRFGDTKEMAVGLGPGYKFNSQGNDFENFYLSALFSYKNFLRIGAGFGYSQVPTDELKGGIQVGDALPADISDLNDLIQYKEKPSVFLTISFTGLNLTKKK